MSKYFKKNNEKSARSVTPGYEKMKADSSHLQQQQQHEQQQQY